MMPSLREGPDLPHVSAGRMGNCHHLHCLARAVCCKGSCPGVSSAHDIIIIIIITLGAWSTSSSCGLCRPGQTCEIDINECVKSPCRNGASCQNTNGSYRCACRTGFSGRNCDTDIDDCKPSKSRGCSGDHALPAPGSLASLPVPGLGSFSPWAGHSLCSEPCVGFWAASKHIPIEPHQSKDRWELAGRSWRERVMCRQ